MITYIAAGSLRGSTRFIHKAILFSVKIDMQRIGIHIDSSDTWLGIKQEMGQAWILPCSSSGKYYAEM